MIRPKSCTVCGARTPDGTSRCPAHKAGGKRMRSCVVCTRPSMGNYCELHQPIMDEQLRNQRSPYRKQYQSAEYQRNRRIRFQRARGRCEGCGVELQPNAWECDHLISLSRGGTNEIENLRVLCVTCHRAKTAFDRRHRQ